MKKRIMAFVMSIVTLITANSCSVKKNNEDSTSGIINEDVTKINDEEVNDNENNVVDVIENVVVNDNLSEDIPIIFEEEIPEIIKTSITISAVGDCTLGRDDSGNYSRSLPYFLDENNNDYSYFFKGVYDILSSDDLTIANLESVFTDSNKKAQKQFNFKAKSDYVNILTEGSVEAVNLANNHTYDYLEKGYNDTIETLENSPVSYFGNGIYSIVNVSGKKIGLCGIKGWNENNACNDIDKAMIYFNENETDLEIFSFHWGEERDYKQNYDQELVARYAIDKGCDLVLGHHPHVLQGIEEYNGKYIIYSLGNFVFGGNKNPSDKDTMIVQITFNYEDGNLISTDINIIPASISSISEYNNYQPIVLEGEKRDKVLKKVLKSSTNFTYEK